MNKILFCTESSHIKSGYGIYAKEIISRLYSTGKYDIAEFASFSDMATAFKHPTAWKFYPNAVSPEDERYESYKSSYSNQFGHWRFDIVCCDFKPDIVIDFRDPWMFEHEAFSSVRNFFKWLIMPPVDSIPQKNDWIRTFAGADLVIPYTKWAKQEFEKYNINLYPEPALAGVDHDSFRPMDKIELREKYGLDQNDFVIGSVMRNQKRKMIPELFECISNLSTQNQNIKLYLHTTYPEASGWNIPELLVEHNVLEKVLFTYKCKKCNKVSPSYFQGPQKLCPHCHGLTAVMSHPSNGVQPTEMAEIYNLFDVYVQYAICEGFGMPQVEAGCCGIPVFSIDYSAMSEVVDSIGGEKIQPLAIMYELESGAKRASHNNKALIDSIKNYRKLSDNEKNSVKNNTRINTLCNYSWDNTSMVWEKAIDYLMQQPNKYNWDTHQPYEVANAIDIDTNQNNYEIAKYIVFEVIKDKNLMRTNFVQKIIRDADIGFVYAGADISPFTTKDMIKKLEQFCNSKKFIDNLRNSDINQDYIEFGNGAFNG